MRGFFGRIELYGAVRCRAVRCDSHNLKPYGALQCGSYICIRCNAVFSSFVRCGVVRCGGFYFSNIIQCAVRLWVQQQQLFPTVRLSVQCINTIRACCILGFDRNRNVQDNVYDIQFTLNVFRFELLQSVCVRTYIGIHYTTVTIRVILVRSRTDYTVPRYRVRRFWSTNQVKPQRRNRLYYVWIPTLQ